MSPFDVRSILLAKHAQHIVIVHFPIALSLASLFLDVVARWRRTPELATAAYYNLVGATISSLVAIVTGLGAWQWLLEGAKLKGNLRLHLVFAIICSGMLWWLWWLRARQRRVGRPPGAMYFVVAMVMAVMIALTGHLGGILSGVVTVNQ